MLNITNERKAKLLGAKSAEEVTELIKAGGQEITEDDAECLWAEITQHRKQDGTELSLDELEAVSGGADRDWAKDGCAATVEPYGSRCGSNDECMIWDVTYSNIQQLFHCPHCGVELSAEWIMQNDRCYKCNGHYRYNYVTRTVDPV